MTGTYFISALFLLLLASLVFSIIAWIGLWLAATKAGHFGLWACLPFIQFFIFSMMAGKPVWWGLLFFIPILNIFIMAIVLYGIAVRFDRGIGTTIGLFLLPWIFWPILGMGSAEYQRNV